MDAQWKEIAYESTFLTGRAQLRTNLYNLAVERKGNFPAVYCDISGQLLPGPL